MSTTELRPAPPPLGHRWYQFTLRELLLAALAFCLLMALFAGQRHSTTTSFLWSFSQNSSTVDQVVTAACAQAGLKVHVLGGPSSAWGRETGGVYYCEVVFDAPPVAESRKVVAALYQEIERLLNADGCKVGGGSGPRDGFEIEYSKGSTEGDVFVNTLHTPEGDPKNFWRLLILIHESVKYGPTAR
jgi:hypothetical protein